MIKSIVKLFNGLNANTNPGDIAHAMACGLLLGFMPKNNLLWYLVLVFVLFMRINKGAYVLALLIGTAFAPLLDNMFDAIGYFVLTIPQLSTFYGNLLEVPFVAFTKFNNTVVMGAFVFGIVLYVPVYWLCRLLIAQWRKHITPAIAQSGIAKAMNKMPFIGALVKIAAGTGK